MRLPVIDTPRCTGCGWCVAACPPHVLSLQAEGWRKHSVLHDQAGCTGCSLCERRCPFGVITMIKKSPNAVQLLQGGGEVPGFCGS